MHRRIVISGLNTTSAEDAPDARDYEEALKDLWGEEDAKGGEGD